MNSEPIYRGAWSKAVFKMFLIMSDNCNIHDLIIEQLKYIPKVILLREFHCIDVLWVKLPEHLKANSKFQQYRCLKHYNLPCHRIHFDGLAPLIKNCTIDNECQQ